ncbi:CBS domain-containing protein [Franzmannia pantelleriensis]|uniref:CBS domain-containing protein n=1 Tax=Franzmannia pantelleriensis TaxID=48727 RepID=A0A1G9UE15_9GAMM|nr:CBS domain-containing protein [Halomonas pantelleriensis]SDM58142.1 CBS domain-containing protein [Halomonas pantelleriensis]
MTLSLHAQRGLSYLQQHPVIERPEPPAPLSWDSPALDVMIDLSRVEVPGVAYDTPIDEARATMEQHKVQQQLVMDAAGRLSGIVTLREVIGGRRITIAMHQHDIARNEVTAGMVQTPCESLHAMPLAQLERLSVGQLIETLRASGDQYLLVTQGDREQPPRLRGLISATDISRALRLDLSLLPGARSFADICQVVLGHEL